MLFTYESYDYITNYLKLSIFRSHIVRRSTRWFVILRMKADHSTVNGSRCIIFVNSARIERVLRFRPQDQIQ